MSKVMHFTIKEKKKDGVSTFEGTGQLEGCTPFKLTKSRSAETKFSTRASLTQSATKFAERFGFELEMVVPKASTKDAPKKKAKKAQEVETTPEDSVVLSA